MRPDGSTGLMRIALDGGEVERNNAGSVIHRSQRCVSSNALMFRKP